MTAISCYNNSRTYNLPNVLYTNIVSNNYYKSLVHLESFEDVLAEIRSAVSFLEPWLPGSGGRKTPSNAMILMMKLFTMGVEENQVVGMLQNQNVFIRGIGVLIIRFLVDPKQVWDWFSEYVDDDTMVTVKQKDAQISMREFIASLLRGHRWLGDVYMPRIPVAIQKEINEQLDEWFGKDCGKCVRDDPKPPPPRGRGACVGGSGGEYFGKMKYKRTRSTSPSPGRSGDDDEKPLKKTRTADKKDGYRNREGDWVVRGSAEDNSRDLTSAVQSGKSHIYQERRDDRGRGERDRHDRDRDRDRGGDTRGRYRDGDGDGQRNRDHGRDRETGRGGRDVSENSRGSRDRHHNRDHDRPDLDRDRGRDRDRDRDHDRSRDWRSNDRDSRDGGRGREEDRRGRRSRSRSKSPSPVPVVSKAPPKSGGGHIAALAKLRSLYGPASSSNVLSSSYGSGTADRLDKHDTCASESFRLGGR
eukprot:TRINITY_DN3924_c0_g1_i1.p1 TRINITY_DN3924_c0_g1~~TRINITY_DN3924_c0_g1_i1.p1  ORF type:complete len:472 (-),score=55.18 TRINITY_DN3924_c0_g1_i1:143-1558(-)